MSTSNYLAQEWWRDLLAEEFLSEWAHHDWHEQIFFVQALKKGNFLFICDQDLKDPCCDLFIACKKEHDGIGGVWRWKKEKKFGIFLRFSSISHSGAIVDVCRLRKVVKILALISKYLFIEKSKECFQIEFGGWRMNEGNWFRKLWHSCSFPKTYSVNNERNKTF